MTNSTFPPATPDASNPIPVGAIGLTAEEARIRLAQDGPNELQKPRRTPWWLTLLAQFQSPVVWLLLAACVISALLGEIVDAAAIGAIVVLNGLVGFFQEYRAENAVLALRAMTVPRARVMRDGKTSMISAAEIVRGDLLLLEAGDIVAADAEVTEANELRTGEAALTGESIPVDKKANTLSEGAPLAERRGQVFLGTAVVNGTGVARVFATGMATELGRIAHLLNTAQVEATPLEKRLAQVSRTLLWLCLGIVALVAVLGLVRGQPWLQVFVTAVSLAVAAVPEGLPAIVTIALSVGVQRMATRNVLVRHLPAVETLGCASVICTDKTGTLTSGTMKVRELWGRDHSRVLEAAAACCDADLSAGHGNGLGDPTELALLSAAAERGVQRSAIEFERPRVEVHPFDSTRKRMSIFRADHRLYVKGAFELLAPLCVQGLEGAAEANDQLAARGLRVLAVAVGKSRDEADLELVGLAGLADPPRTEAVEAIAQARLGGIKTVMITGDHPVTAEAIAREMGIIRPGDSAAELVHARATPEEKLQIVREWKKRGAVVAMTGDGVNDAPALREAHIGIAMGLGGTEVTREAADLVLTDDNFASIVAAVREGRGIFDNIRKTVVYLLAGNFGELTVMLVAAVAGLPLPLLPLHLLWINLVTDGLPALALVVDPPDGDVLRKPPRGSAEPLLGRSEWSVVACTGALQAAATLGVFVWALQARNLQEARNLAFSTLVFGELFRAFAARSPKHVFWETGVFSNLVLLAVLGVSVVMQLALHHIPFTQRLFSLGALSPSDCALSLGVALIPATVVELGKLARRALWGYRHARHAATFITVAASTLFAGSASAEPGCETYVAEVLARQPSLQAGALRQTAFVHESEAAGVWPDPTLSVMADRFPGTAAGAEMPMLRYQLTQMVMWPGKLPLMRDAIRAEASAASANLETRKQDLALEARRAYFMLILNGQRRELNRAARSLASTIASTALTRYASQAGGHHEVVRAELEVQALDVEYEALGGERRGMLAMLNSLRFQPPDTPFPEPEKVSWSDPKAISMNAAMASALQQRPELREMFAMKESMSKMAALARKEPYPDLMVGAWYNQMLMGAPHSFGVMVGGTLPLWGARRAGQKAAAFDARAESIARDTASMTVMFRAQVIEALTRFETTARQIGLLEGGALPKARENFSTSLSAYSTGSLDILGVLDSRRSLQNAESMLIDARVQHELSLALLQHAVGGKLPGGAP
jgi:Ca2+-transporting ATPase